MLGPWDYFLAILMIVTAIFLILLILVQRGRGGGLAGALGGMGGQSAFGTKAGDLFTRITIGTAAFWIVLLVVCVKVMSGGGGLLAVGSNVPIDSTQTNVEAEPLPGEKSAKPDSQPPASSTGKETKGDGAAVPAPAGGDAAKSDEATSAPPATDETK